MSVADWFDDRARARVKPGDGRPLPPFRWWQLLSRSVFFLRTPTATYAVDVRIAGDRDDGEVRARLYRNGVQTAVSKVPARFPVDGGRIEVAATLWGLKRCHFVADDGTETQLEPHPRSGEGRRARFDRAHPAASRAVGMVSVGVVIVGVALTVMQLLESVTSVPTVQEVTGIFVSPVRLPVAANVGVVLLIAAASVERALRLRSSWLDHLAG
jgi:hypothetical protein